METKSRQQEINLKLGTWRYLREPTSAFAHLGINKAFKCILKLCHLRKSVQNYFFEVAILLVLPLLLAIETVVLLHIKP